MRPCARSPALPLPQALNVMDSNFTSEDGVFDGAGILAFTTIMDDPAYDAWMHHTNADFFETVSERDLQQSATIMAVFAYQAAMRNEKIPRRPAGVPASPRAVVPVTVLSGGEQK
jgi:carboxypeptidase Q